MNVSTLQNLESQGAHRQIEQQITDALKRKAEPAMLKYASAYFVRRGQPAKSLACYAEYVQNSTANERDLEAIEMAIDCARRIGRHELVRDFFLNLQARERETLASPALMHVAASFIKLGQLDEAEKILRFVRNNSGAKQLLTFDELITSRFGTIENAAAYTASTKPQFSKAEFYASVKQAVNLALAHMAQGNFTTAENILQSCKTEVAA